MTAASLLGASFRKLGSLLNARAVRTDDAARAVVRADLSAFAQRADAIAAEALKIERELSN